MQRFLKDKWVRDRDLADTPHGREDDRELVERCVNYLFERGTGEHAVVELPPAAAVKARAELVTAHVRASVRVRPDPHDVDLKRRLEEAEATIDRLLAFVPGRAKELSDHRIAELLEALRVAASAAFPNRHLDVFVEPEADVDSPACHRITILVEATNEDDPSAFAASVAKVHRKLASSADQAEYQALRLIVEPNVKHAG